MGDERLHAHTPTHPHAHTSSQEGIMLLLIAPLVESILSVLLFSLIGIALFGLAFFIMEKVTPFSIRKEIEEDQNIALAIVIASVILGIALIIVASIAG
jgi:uncharacterized membrane protein YjfL (UPF0719 family)